MSFIKNWLRPEIQNIRAYSVANAQNMIKLDAMESPFFLSKTLAEQHLAQLAKAPLNRYPDPSAKQLQQTVRELMQIPPELDILLGNGSDELIQILALACATGDTILSISPSFVMYDLIAKFTRLNYHSVDLGAEFEIDLPAFQAAITTHRPKLIFIAYPNNPTGNAFERHKIEQIIQSTDALVVLDEAYYAYASDSFLGDIAKYPNLVLLRTVSKIGFAGLRLGLLIGARETVVELNKLRLPYNINTLTQVSANFLLQAKHEIAKNAQMIIAERAKLSAALATIRGVRVYPSEANFILFKAQNASELFAHLCECGVLIKNLCDAPKLHNCLRVTVGSASENATFVKIVAQYYGE